MRLAGITSLCAIFVIALTACAAPETKAQHENQPHLPPPDFAATEVSSKPRYCGVRGGTICDTGEFCRRTIKAACGTFDLPGAPPFLKYARKLSIPSADVMARHIRMNARLIHKA